MKKDKKQERLNKENNFHIQSKQLGERIKHIRTLSGLTQEQFAASLGMGNANLSGIENGTKNPKLSFFFKLVKLYQVSLDYLFLGIGEPTLRQKYAVNNPDREQVNDIRTIDDFFRLMEQSSIFRDTMMGQGAKFLYDNEDIINRNIQKLKENHSEDKLSDFTGNTGKN